MSLPSIDDLLGAAPAEKPAAAAGPSIDDLLGPDTAGTIKMKVLLDETVGPQDTAPRPVELDPDSAAARAQEDSIRRTEIRP